MADKVSIADVDEYLLALSDQSARMARSRNLTDEDIREAIKRLDAAAKNTEHLHCYPAIVFREEAAKKKIRPGLYWCEYNTKTKKETRRKM